MSLFTGDIVLLIKAIGYLGLFLIIFAESGLFFGFFLPGGSLLFTAGLLASQGYFNIYFLIIILGLAAVIGDNVGYWFGYKIGPKIFNKEDSIFFRKDHVVKTKEFYDKYGSNAIILGRLIPIARTFAPILAGVAQMNYKKFFYYNILGAIFWAIGVSLLGYFLGSKVPGIDKYILPIILLIIFLSIVPILWKINWKKIFKNEKS